MILILALAFPIAYLTAIVLGELDNLGLTRYSRPYNPEE